LINPYDPDDRMPLYQVDMYPVDGGARGDTALVLTNAVDNAPVARWIFSDKAMCGEPDPRVDRFSVPDWMASIVAANFTEGRDICDDCGNVYPNHSPDCEL
jgi:hypothetical protein